MKKTDIRTREQLEKRILRISFVMSCILSLAEVIAAIILRSHTVLMDAIFDSADLIMMGPFLVLVPLLYQPVSERRPYGYSQVESLFLIIKYTVLLILVVAMMGANVHIILTGGHQVSSGAIAVFELCLAAASVIMYFFLLHMSKKYESPTIRAEIYMWKTDIIGSCGVAAAFLAQFFLGDTVLKPLTPYIDSGVALIMSLFLIAEPVREIIRGFRQMMLFSPPDEDMDRVHGVVKAALRDYPYEATFIDVIQTGRKTWIEVYLKRSDDNAVIDTGHWKDLRGRVVEELSDDFDQLYVEFIPDIPES
ncbi:MAG: cation transporter [Mogibacterium sp.]|nr:cation transporter [Mogibacterium sp.]